MTSAGPSARRRMPPSASAPLSHCGGLVRRSDRDRFLLALLAPPDRREALLTLFAWNVEVARVPDLVSEPMTGLLRLQYWRDVLTSHDPAAAARGHPVGEALVREVLPHLGAEERSGLIDSLEARADDLPPDPPADVAAARRLATRTAGRMAHLGVVLLGATDADSRAAAEAAGTAWGLLVLARGVAAQVTAGRLRLPMDAVSRAGCDAEAILAGRDPTRRGIRAGVEALVTEARAILEAGRGQAAAADRAARPMLRARLQAEVLARRLTRSDHDPFAPKAANAPPPMIRLLLDRVRHGA